MTAAAGTTDLLGKATQMYDLTLLEVISEFNSLTRLTSSCWQGWFFLQAPRDKPFPLPCSASGGGHLLPSAHGYFCLTPTIALIITSTLLSDRLPPCDKNACDCFGPTYIFPDDLSILKILNHIFKVLFAM